MNWQIFVVKSSSLWVFTASKIFKINLKTKKTETILNGDNDFGIPFKYNSTIYFQTNNAINRVTVSDQIEHLLTTKLLNRKSNGKTIGQGKSRIFKLDKQMFLMQNRSHINTFFKIDISKNLSLINGFKAINKHNIYTVFENGNEVWIGTNKGVWMFEYINNQFHFKKQFLKNKNVTKILKDKKFKLLVYYIKQWYLFNPEY